MLVDAAKGIEDRTRKLFEVSIEVSYFLLPIFRHFTEEETFLTHYPDKLHTHCNNYQVCRMRKLPIFSFANKMDRPSLTPYEIIDQVMHSPLFYSILLYSTLLHNVLLTDNGRSTDKETSVDMQRERKKQCYHISFFIHLISFHLSSSLPLFHCYPPL